MIAGYGPFTLTEEDARELVSLAMVIASSVSLMEKDVKFTEKLLKHCAETYADPDSITVSGIDESFTLSSSTKCIGGLQ